MAVALGATAGLVHDHAIRRLFDRPPTERHEACPVVQEALVFQAHGVRQVAGEADVDGRRRRAVERGAYTLFVHRMAGDRGDRAALLGQQPASSSSALPRHRARNQVRS